MLCKPLCLCTTPISLDSTNELVNVQHEFSTEKLYSDVKSTLPCIRSTSGLKFKKLFLLCGTLLYYTLMLSGCENTENSVT